MQTKDWPDVTPGSIIAFTGRATRGSEGETREVFALVMSQEPFDGSLTCFAFHFEGQFQAVLPVVTRTPVRGPDGVLTGMDIQPTFRMVFDAGADVQGQFSRLYDSELIPMQQTLIDLKECAQLHGRTINNIGEAVQGMEQKFVEFQTQVLEMITASVEPARVDSTRKSK